MTVSAGAVGLRSALPGELDVETFYRLLALRVDVFVVEQNCPYPELDGRDLEPATRHLWLEADGLPVAYLRILSEPDASARIGRVCVAAGARRRGLAGRLMGSALEQVQGRTCVLDAQSHLQHWYAGFGFEAIGEEYLEDGIPHVPMRRPLT